MIKFIAVLIITVLVLMFAMQNSHTVIVNMFFVGPVQERLFFLLMTFYVLGLLTMLFAVLLRNAAKKKAEKK